MGPVPGIYFESLSSISLRACKQLVWYQVKHWCSTSPAEDELLSGVVPRYQGTAAASLKLRQSIIIWKKC